MRYILGISAYYHDAAAALLRDGRILAAGQEERFSRRKNDERFPSRAVAFCLKFAGINPSELDAVVFYDKPIPKFARMLESYLAVAPAGFPAFIRVLPGWLGEKLNLRETIRLEIPGLRPDCPILFTEHHHAHAASAFYPSPFSEAAILTVDGVGEWATTTIGQGSGSTISLLQELRFPHSLGLLYSAFTAYCGFKINSGEYKLMGLAPYGEPRYAGLIFDQLLDVKNDGSFWLNPEYFAFLRRFSMTNDRFHRLFGGPPREPESPLEQRHMDVAASIQAVTNEVMLKLARHAQEVTGKTKLCLAGGVALNCVANGLILRDRIFDDLWIQPAAGDAGGALGAALAVAAVGGQVQAGQGDQMQGALLGPEFTDPEVKAVLDAHGAAYQRLDEDEVLDRTVELLAKEKVVGWVQGRMEFGPRALGNRSILGDPRSPRMQAVMNLKVKYRESFRPFAPAILAERTREYFDLPVDSPYMLLVAPVQKTLRTDSLSPASGLERLKQLRSTIPAVTHVDFSARVQTVRRENNPRFHALLERFARATGCPLLVNTSFNVRGEPVVCSPEDAYQCFVNTEMDYLVIGNYLLARERQPKSAIPRKGEPVPD